MFHPDLKISPKDRLFKKGVLETVDSYSGFGKTNYEDTGLKEHLLSNFQNEKIFIVGLAFDFCVGKTALDAAALGFQVYVVKDLTKSTNVKSEEEMELQLKASHNISIVTSN